MFVWRGFCSWRGSCKKLLKIKTKIFPWLKFDPASSQDQANQCLCKQTCLRGETCFARACVLGACDWFALETGPIMGQFLSPIDLSMFQEKRVKKK